MSGKSSLQVIGLVLALAAPLAAQQSQIGRGGPYVELREPRFVPAAQADFLKSGDRVVGVDENGVTKAYVIYVMAFHHIIQDRLGKMPILVTW